MPARRLPRATRRSRFRRQPLQAAQREHAAGLRVGARHLPDPGSSDRRLDRCRIGSLATLVAGAAALIAGLLRQSPGLKRCATWALAYTIVAVALLFTVGAFEL